MSAKPVKVPRDFWQHEERLYVSHGRVVEVNSIVASRAEWEASDYAADPSWWPRFKGDLVLAQRLR